MSSLACITGTQVRGLIEAIIEALDGDGSGKISQAEVLRFWKVRHLMEGA